MQENYLWTDKLDFKSLLENKQLEQVKNQVQHGDLQIDLMRKLLNNYYNTVVEGMQDTIPKCVMYFLVKMTEDQLSSNLYEKVKNEDINNLILEYDDINIQRIELEKSNIELNKARELIESIV